jgi:N-acetylmuramic acid 6-phosphate etherase
MTYEQTLSSFLSVCDQFKLGNLVTESPHPLTTNLSDLVKNDPVQAVQTLKDVDLLALSSVIEKIPLLVPLHKEIQATLDEGGNIFLCGCGATGRLSLALEFIWRSEMSGSPLEDRVKGFMAGGDCALIASIEKFEDYQEYGERQLRELGFSENDLMIGITEGGETPFVIGATVEAEKTSNRQPYFIYCNPDDLLCEAAERSKHVIENENIHKINLESGPMAITGSTRMQATTVQMMAVGSCLVNFASSFETIKSEITNFHNSFKNLNVAPLAEFITKEASLYNSGEYVFYDANENYGITILTDTTERSPTFSLSPFENEFEPSEPSLCYLVYTNETSNESAWNSLLKREPRAFHWPEISAKTKIERLYGFDISKNIIEKRNKYLAGMSHLFSIKEKDDRFIFELDGIKTSFSCADMSFLMKHMLLKLILNNMSTNIMGVLGRYEGNVMTWVRPSNYKLIDRTIRYVDLLTKKEGKEFSYQHIAEKVFDLIPKTNPNDALVLAVTKDLLKK